MSEKETSEKEAGEKGPWIWKAAIVALPLGLAVSAIVAVALKVSRGEQTGMEGISYRASEFDVANLRDAASKAGDLIGGRNFETPEGQKSMQQVVSFVTGSLSSINLGYQVQSDDGSVANGRLWKNYWIDSSGKADDGTLLVWCLYSKEEESASVAALLSVAEWLRGRSFQRRVRVAFVRDESSLASVTADFPERGDEIHFAISGFGYGSQGLLKTGGGVKAEQEAAYYRFEGQGGAQTASDWKMTAAWEGFEAQVRELCEEISEEAGEKVVFEKGS